MVDASNEWQGAKVDLERPLPDQSSSNGDGSAAGDLEQVFVQLTDARNDFTYENHPHNWAWITMELGSLSVRRKEGGKPANVRSAIDYFTEALKVYRQESHPLEWARCHSGIGRAFWRLASGESRALEDQALDHFKAALRSITQDDWPYLWHSIHRDLSMLYQDYAVHSADADECLALAQEHHRLAFSLDRKKFPDFYDSMARIYDLHSQLLALRKEFKDAQSREDAANGQSAG
jgi:tetratricopeptide (TPR) repeat protein